MQGEGAQAILAQVLQDSMAGGNTKHDNLERDLAQTVSVNAYF